MIKQGKGIAKSKGYTLGRAARKPVVNWKRSRKLKAEAEAAEAAAAAQAQAQTENQDQEQTEAHDQGGSEAEVNPETQAADAHSGVEEQVNSDEAAADRVLAGAALKAEPNSPELGSSPAV